jgi:hypothetical protein
VQIILLSPTEPLKTGALFYSAFIQLSDPVSFTATPVKLSVSGAPSAVPLCSVETRSGPAFLYPAQLTITRLGFLGPPRW